MMNITRIDRDVRRLSKFQQFSAKSLSMSKILVVVSCSFFFLGTMGICFLFLERLKHFTNVSFKNAKNGHLAGRTVKRGIPTYLIKGLS